MAFAEGTWVWVRDEAQFCLAARVTHAFTAGDAAVVELEDGRELALSAAETSAVAALDPQVLDGGAIHDLISLSDLRAEALLHILRGRFSENAIYTSIGSILVSVGHCKGKDVFKRCCVAQATL